MIITDLRELVNKTFHLFDFDGNGVIEKKDFLELAKRNAEITGGSSEDLRDELYYRTNIHLWNQIESHVDIEYGPELPDDAYDGKITPMEWYTYWIDHIYSDEPGEVAFNWTNLLFDLVDKDASGSIDKKEYKEFLELYKLPNISQIVEDVFSQIDTDQDNLISKLEMVNNISDFFRTVKHNLSK